MGGKLTLVLVLANARLAFRNIGIFWTNHHHMLATASRVNGRALWANLFLLCLKIRRDNDLQSTV
jgi:uncharacterized membrane protein